MMSHIDVQISAHTYTHTVSACTAACHVGFRRNVQPPPTPPVRKKKNRLNTTILVKQTKTQSML